MSDWHLYVIRAADDTLYTGITTDVSRRLDEHATGRGGARYLRGRAPLSLMYQAGLGSRSVALRAEYAFKQLSRTRKLSLLAEQPDADALLAFLGVEAAVNEDDGVDNAGQDSGERQ